MTIKPVAAPVDASTKGPAKTTNGSKGGKSFGKGKVAVMMKMMQSMFGKGKGGGKGGKGRMTHRNLSAEKKVWLGNLPDGITSRELHEHFKQVEGCKWVDVFRNGTGAACFLEPGHAIAALSTMNGSVVNGQTIEVDVWTKQEKE